MMELPSQFSAGFSAHILVMDDAPPILGLFREILEEEGYRVTTSQERLDVPRIRALHPDLILLDLQFAGVQETPAQFLAAVRQDAALEGIPIILCTVASAAVRDGVLAEQLRQLRVRVMRKPFDIDELLTVLAEAVTAARDEFVCDLPVGSNQ